MTRRETGGPLLYSEVRARAVLVKRIDGLRNDLGPLQLLAPLFALNSQMPLFAWVT